MAEIKPRLRYSETDTATLRSMFFENEALLTALRQYFLQLPMDGVQVALVKGLTQAQIEMIRREILPSLEDNAPVGMSTSAWLNLDQHIQAGVTEAYPRFLQREKAVEYFEQMFKNLVKGEWNYDIKLADMIRRPFASREKEELYVGMAAYLSIVASVEKNLLTLNMLGNQDIKSPKEIMDAVQKNSAK